MKLVRFVLEDNQPKLGAVLGESVVELGDEEPLSFLRRVKASGLSGAEFLKSHYPLDRLSELSYAELEEASKPPRLLMPLIPSEVWGCGVTYLRSRAARETETVAKGIYDRVYDAKRPEVFFKGTPHRCVGPNDYVGIREDSKWTVPEPEFTLVLDESGLVGYTIGNDVSARDIEGENPLYLPQAKIYEASCSLGPTLVTPESIGNARDLKIQMTIRRDGKAAFEGETSTASIKRSFDELIGFLMRNNPVPAGSVCLTGTGIVPPDDFSLRHGDSVDITVENVGTLRNPVKQL